MLLPRKPTKIERMWWAISSIHRWNTVGGLTVFYDPAPNAIGQWKKRKKAAERDYRRKNRKQIRENRIGLWDALRQIWEA